MQRIEIRTRRIITKVAWKCGVMSCNITKYNVLYYNTI